MSAPEPIQPEEVKKPTTDWPKSRPCSKPCLGVCECNNEKLPSGPAKPEAEEKLDNIKEQTSPQIVTSVPEDSEGIVSEHIPSLASKARDVEPDVAVSLRPKELISKPLVENMGTEPSPLVSSMPEKSGNVVAQHAPSTAPICEETHKIATPQLSQESVEDIWASCRNCACFIEPDEDLDESPLVHVCNQWKRKEALSQTPPSQELESKVIDEDSSSPPPKVNELPKDMEETISQTPETTECKSEITHEDIGDLWTTFINDPCYIELEEDLNESPLVYGCKQWRPKVVVSETSPTKAPESIVMDEDSSSPPPKVIGLSKDMECKPEIIHEDIEDLWTNFINDPCYIELEEDLNESPLVYGCKQWSPKVVSETSPTQALESLGMDEDSSSLPPKVIELSKDLEYKPEITHEDIEDLWTNFINDPCNIELEEDLNESPLTYNCTTFKTEREISNQSPIAVQKSEEIRRLTTEPTTVVPLTSKDSEKIASEHTQTPVFEDTENHPESSAIVQSKKGEMISKSSHDNIENLWTTFINNPCYYELEEDLNESPLTYGYEKQKPKVEVASDKPPIEDSGGTISETPAAVTPVPKDEISHLGEIPPEDIWPNFINVPCNIELDEDLETSPLTYGGVRPTSATVMSKSMETLVNDMLDTTLISKSTLQTSIAIRLIEGGKNQDNVSSDPTQSEAQEQPSHKLNVKITAQVRQREEDSLPKLISDTSNVEETKDLGSPQKEPEESVPAAPPPEKELWTTFINDSCNIELDEDDTPQSKRDCYRDDEIALKSSASPVEILGTTPHKATSDDDVAELWTTFINDPCNIELDEDDVPQSTCDCNRDDEIALKSSASPVEILDKTPHKAISDDDKAELWTTFINDPCNIELDEDDVPQSTCDCNRDDDTTPHKTTSDGAESSEDDDDLFLDPEGCDETDETLTTSTKAELLQKVAALQRDKEQLEQKVRNLEEEKKLKSHGMAAYEGFTESELQAALEVLKSKCRMKDVIITALADDLRMRCPSGVYDHLLKNVAEENVEASPPRDFNREQLCEYLNRPPGYKGRAMPPHPDPAAKECEEWRRRTYEASDPLPRRVTSPPAPPPEEKVDVAVPSPSGLQVMRRVGPDSLLVRWDVPQENISGYEIYVNGVLAEIVSCASRDKALLECLDLHSKVVLTLYALTPHGRSLPACAVYPDPGHEVELRSFHM
ncbi:uncharacterized protein [Periplaneta americana]|uniref:uncharacterized protein n=1 Tax=Periplaneta americana TaxID=6978 RepID=UPI0037E70BB2